MAITKAQLFPIKAVNEIHNLVRGDSSLAKLSEQKPLAFNGNRVFTFNFDNEAGIVGERGAKPVGGATVAAVDVVPFKVEYGTRVSEEFMYGAEEVKLDIFANFKEAFAKKVAQQLDSAAFHAINRRTGTTAQVISGREFDTLVTQTVTRSNDVNKDIEDAIALVQSRNHEVTGMAMAPSIKQALANLKKTDGTPYYSELSWGASPATLNGLPIHTNATVAEGNASLAYVGDFKNFFRWGISRDIELRVLTAGNPDGSEDGDLAAHNEVYLRGECYVGFAIIVPNAFARIVPGE